MLTFIGEQVDLLRAAQVAAAKNDVRYYLNGVYFGGGCVVGTDGARLVVVKNQVPDDFLPVILPLKPIPRGVLQVDIENAEGDMWLVEYHKAKTTDHYVARSIDGNYPDFMRVVDNPGPDDKPASGFNWTLWSELQEALRANALQVRFYNDKGVVEFGDATIAVMATRI